MLASVIARGVRGARGARGALGAGPTASRGLGSAVHPDDARLQRVRSPMMKQYLATRKQHPEFLVLFRVGGFFEFFGSQAATAAKALDMSLAVYGPLSRMSGVKFTGFPAHTLDDKLVRLVKSGHKVAVCDQVEPPEGQPSGRLLQRVVTQLVTPGTLTLESLLLPKQSNFLLALHPSAQGDVVGMAWVDISIGTIQSANCRLSDLGVELARIDPAEVLVPTCLASDPAVAALGGSYVLSDVEDPAEARTEELLDDFFAAGPAHQSASRAPFVEKQAIGTMLGYILMTQRRPLKDMAVSGVADQAMSIDPFTRISLELLMSTGGSKQGSLLECLDATRTAGGGRLLRQRILGPSTSLPTVVGRLDTVDHVRARFSGGALRGELIKELESTYDVARIVQRVVADSCSAADLRRLSSTLQAGRAIAALFQPLERDDLPHFQQQLAGLTCVPEAVSADLDRALGRFDESPSAMMIADGFSEELDELRSYTRDSTRDVRRLAQRYSKELDVPMTVGYLPKFGHHLSVKATHRAALVDHKDFVCLNKSASKSPGRYHTTEFLKLAALQSEKTAAASVLERRLFDELVGEVKQHSNEIRAFAAALAEMDVAATFAATAIERGYVKPVMTDGLDFDVVGGRHPVVESVALRSEQFTPNDCLLSDKRLALITGPNMSGKSTFLRQQALIAIMAQCGSFVPAESAVLGVADKIFSRVGAYDDISNDRSTFMVEMSETAVILHSATERSLVILDEVGRGTATVDGISIAQAVLEHVHSALKCRALFATHYHELQQMADTLDSLTMLTTQVGQRDGRIEFWHKIVPGVSNDSFGIEVARMAGVPPSVLERAAAIMADLRSAGR